MHFLARTLAKCSSHFVVKADGKVPTSYVTNVVYRIAISPTFYNYVKCLL